MSKAFMHLTVQPYTIIKTNDFIGTYAQDYIHTAES